MFNLNSSTIWEVKEVGIEYVNIAGRFTDPAPADELAAMLRAYYKAQEHNDVEVYVLAQDVYTALPPVYRFVCFISFVTGEIVHQAEVSPRLDQNVYRDWHSWPATLRGISLGVSAYGEIAERAEACARIYYRAAEADGTLAEFRKRYAKRVEKDAYVETELAKLEPFGSQSDYNAVDAVLIRADEMFGV